MLTKNAVLDILNLDMCKKQIDSIKIIKAKNKMANVKFKKQ